MPLTAAQIKKYGPLWGRASTANDWRMERGRIAANGSGDSPWHREVWSLGEQHALQQHRGITADDLRRACNALVAGRYCSTYDLTNKQFTRLLALFRLLIEPTDIEAQLDFNEPSRAEDRWLDRVITKLAPDAYTAEISARIYGTKDWRNLEVKDKRNLRRILAERRRQWDAPVTPEVEAELDPANAPF